MHKLEITGETPEALYFNIVKTLSLFLRGPAQTTAVTEPIVMAKTATELSEEFANTQSAEQEVIPPKSGKKTKAKPDKLPSDPLPDVMTGGKTIEHDVNEIEGKPALTLDGDIKPRLQAIQAACTKRGMEMPACVEYIMKLYGPFGIANAKQLKPEQFAEFMAASEGYLSGEA